MIILFLSTLDRSKHFNPLLNSGKTLNTKNCLKIIPNFLFSYTIFKNGMTNSKKLSMKPKKSSLLQIQDFRMMASQKMFAKAFYKDFPKLIKSSKSISSLSKTKISPLQNGTKLC